MGLLFNYIHRHLWVLLYSAGSHDVPNEVGVISIMSGW